MVLVLANVVGLEYHEGTKALPFDMQDAPCTLMREPENAFDTNAIKVLVTHNDGRRVLLGYVRASQACVLSQALDVQTAYGATVNSKHNINLSAQWWTGTSRRRSPRPLVLRAWRMASAATRLIRRAATWLPGAAIPTAAPAAQPPQLNVPSLKRLDTSVQVVWVGYKLYTSCIQGWSVCCEMPAGDATV